MQGPSELGHAITATSVRMTDPEDRMLVRVEGHGFAMPLKVLARGMEVVKGRLAGDKPEVHQPARGIVDEDQQGAARTAVLKPVVIGAVDLDQFAQAFASVARLMNGLVALLAILPEPGRHHPLAQGLTPDMQIVALGQLLTSKGWTKIRIVRPHQSHDRLLQGRMMAPVAGATTLARHKTRRTVLSEPP